MQLNKRRWILGGTIFVLLIVGIPYLTGKLVKRQFEDILTVFSELDPVSIQVLDYQEGWFSSRAKTRVTFKGKSMPMWLREGLQHQDFSIILEHKIQHGPFIFSRSMSWRNWRLALAMIQSQLYLTKEAKAQLQQITSDTKLLKIQSQIGIDGEFLAIFEGKPIVIQDDKGVERTIWQGMQGKWHINRGLNRFLGEVVIPGFDLQWHHRRFVGEAMRYRTQRTKSSTGIWLGKDNILIGQLQMIPTEPALPIVLMGITMGVILDEKQGLINAGLDTTIESVKWGQQLYGPLNTVIALNRLSPESVKSVIANLNNIQMTGKYQPYLGYMLMQVPVLLKARPELHIDNLSLRTVDGEVKGQLQVAIGGKEANNMTQIGNIVDSLFVSAGVNIPQSMAKELLALRYRDQLADEPITPAIESPSMAVPEQPAAMMNAMIQKADTDIDSYVQAGYLMPKGNDYTMDLRYENGALTINGKPWPPVNPRG